MRNINYSKVNSLSKNSLITKYNVPFRNLTELEITHSYNMFIIWQK